MMYFLQGLTMGLAYVAPIGLQNLFVINTALTRTKRYVFLTAIIVTFFDVTLALACFFGIGAVMEHSKWLKMAILLIGSIVVIMIGISLLKAKGSMDGSPDVNKPVLKIISTACVVTWFNPQALIDGSVMLGAFKATLPEGQDLNFILGVAGASFLWFFGLSTIISLFSAKITDKVLRIINIICGTVIIIYGVKLGVSFVKIIAPLI